MTRCSFPGCAPAVAAVLVLAGCQTPPAVYELADKTSSNAGVLQGHLAEVSAQSTALAQQRVEHILVLEKGTTRLDAQLQRELYMQQQSRTVDDWAKVDKLQRKLNALRDSLVEIEASAVLASEDRRKEMLATQNELETYREALRQVAASLSALAKKESTEERVKFLAGFARDVRNDMKKSLADGDRAAKDAKKLIDHLKGDADKGEAQETRDGAK